MAISGLTPLIYINNKHFTFDTGADHTLFYHNLYLENKDKIDKNINHSRLVLEALVVKRNLMGIKLTTPLRLEKKK